jgi:multicomponent Na+:H+ antiporter subunit D
VTLTTSLPLAVAVPATAAGIALLLRRLPALASTALSLVAVSLVVTLNATVVARASAGDRLFTWVGAWQPRGTFSIGISLVGDQVGAGVALTAAVLTGMALIYTSRYYETVDSHFHALLLLFLAGMEGFALSGDLFDMFVFFELMGAAAYALTGFKVEDPSSLQGALNFGVINSLGAYFSLFGIGLLYARAGQLGLASLGHTLSGHPADALVIAAFVLISSGLLVKAAMVPLHFWLADAHAVAPTPVCLLFSGVMVELGLYGFARVWLVVFSGTIPVSDVRRAFLIMGALTAVIGAVMCFMQRHVKRLLAYSTIAHVGLFLLGIALADPRGTAGVAVYVVGHAGVKGSLFLLAGVMLNQYGSVDEVTLHGRGRQEWPVGVLFLVGGLALAGLPPFGTGLGKAMTEDALSKAGQGWASALFVAVSAVTGAAIIRATLRIYFGLGQPAAPADSLFGPGQTTSGDEERPEADEPPDRWPTTMLGPAAALLAAALVLGVWPHAGAAFERAAARFGDASGYIRQVLALRPAPSRLAPTGPAWTGTGLALDFASAIAAMALASVAVFVARVPQPMRRPLRAARPFARVLRDVHSGHVGDYAAWFLAGLATLAALIALPLR